MSEQDHGQNETGEHHNEHHHHHENEHHDQHHSLNHRENNSVSPSAPPSDDNGYIVVPPAPQSSSIDTHHSEKTSDILSKESQEEISKLLIDISNSTDNTLTNRGIHATVVAEADSSTSAKPNKTPAATAAPSSSSSGCSLCPYYFLACNYVTKVQVPPKVKDLLLWTDPKLTGAVFGSLFVLLLSLSLCSFLTVSSSLLLLALTVIGSYRFYLALVFRIKGIQDPTFEKLSAFDLSLPKDKVKQLANLLETDINKGLNQLKSILLWDNISTSALTFVGLYVVYCIGSVFNTLTLLIIILVDLFTLPKVYQVYKKPIDQAIEQATNSVHSVVKQVIAKFPFLQKKKVQ